MYKTQLCLGFIQPKSISVINYNELSAILHKVSIKALKNKIPKLDSPVLFEYILPYSWSDHSKP
jgi:hypothetical protein